jgi:hypothetical protein
VANNLGAVAVVNVEVKAEAAVSVEDEEGARAARSVHRHYLEEAARPPRNDIILRSQLT